MHTFFHKLFNLYAHTVAVMRLHVHFSKKNNSLCKFLLTSFILLNVTVQLHGRKRCYTHNDINAVVLLSSCGKKPVFFTKKPTTKS